MTNQGLFSPPNLPDMPFPLTEVLVEPGSYQLWASFSNHQTHRVDLRPLLNLAPYQSLRLDTLFARVQVSADGSRLIWPGGACIDGPSFLQTGSERLPIHTLAVVPAIHRYRPLLPYLQYQQPHTYLRPTPIEPVTVQSLLQLRTGELNEILRSVPVPPEPLLNRLYDLGMFLRGHFAHEHLLALMRRPWRYAEQRYPHHAFLHTMVGCLQHGRPDLIERPCMLIATGE